MQLKHLTLLSILLYSPLALASETNITVDLIYYRITGLKLHSSDYYRQKMQEAMDRDGPQAAAELASRLPNFYNIILRRFSAPMSTRAETDMVPLNDMQALMIGTIMDNLDFRTALTGNFRYTPDGSNITGYSDNNAFADFSDRFSNLNYLQKVSPAWPNLADKNAAGVFTTRAWAESHYAAGTNRRAVEYTFREFLCANLPEWKTPNLPTHMIHRDIPRDPSGSTLEFDNNCRSCHALLDGMVGAFARVDFNRSISILTSGVVAKMNQDPHVFPAGYEVVDDYWINFATTRQNTRFGWRGDVEGSGLKAFATMIANSRGFSECMVQRAYQAVCKKDRRTLQGEELRVMTDSFEADYNMRNVFVNVATSPVCQ